MFLVAFLGHGRTSAHRASARVIFASWCVRGSELLPGNSGELKSKIIRTKTFSVLSQATSATDFKRYFAAEALINDPCDHEGTFTPASPVNRENSAPVRLCLTRFCLFLDIHLFIDAAA